MDLFKGAAMQVSGLPCPACGVSLVAMMTRQGPAWTCICSHPHLRKRGKDRVWEACGGYGDMECSRESPSARIARGIEEKMEAMLKRGASESDAIEKKKGKRRGKS